MNIKACLFDLDGVILSTDKYHYLAWKRLANHLGFDFSEKDNEKLKGIGRMESLDMLLDLGKRHLDSDTKTRLAEMKNNWYLDCIAKLSYADILPHAMEFVEELRRNNIKAALCSSSKNACRILQNLNLTDKFDIIIDGNQIGFPKPNPEIYLKAAEALGISAALCVVFEDAQSGIDAAKSAGMRCVGIGSAGSLDMADIVVSSFKEISLSDLLNLYKDNGLKLDPWCIIEEGFHPDSNRVFESIFSLGNEYMGQRAYFEESYSGDSLQGSYIGGIYCKDKTKVGWWKVGYPEYYSKVINSINWIGIDIEINGKTLDLAKCKTEGFIRTLNMKEGYLKRSFMATLETGEKVQITFWRFISEFCPNMGTVRCSIMPLNFSGTLKLTFYLDGDVLNEDSNYGESFWENECSCIKDSEGYVMAKTKSPEFHVCAYMRSDIFINGAKQDNLSYENNIRDKYVSGSVILNCMQGDKIVTDKYACIVTSRDCLKENIISSCRDILYKACNYGYDFLFEKQREAWNRKWALCDIVIEGDMSSQQALRFNIFQLNQTYSGKDKRLNIGPKGFTGEKYGGGTYWDTEAYCLPYYLSTSLGHTAKNLLLYRYNQLDKARENARKLGFSKGALYPMVTMDGEECHNEWEITFEEIHRNGAIAYAIHNYVNYTGDQDYLYSYGLEVLVELCRFWEQRINFSEAKMKYVILGVTGPNEYENNVNNNWYTNRIASWTLEYTLKELENLERNEEGKYRKLQDKLNLCSNEINAWKDIIGKMYYPEDKSLSIFLQQDGYMDKEQRPASGLDPSELPLNQHWSWDRILRSCFIKQGDVLQGLFFLKDYYDLETIKRNFDYYEARTVHESSLSLSLHAILASILGYKEKAFELFKRSCNLDLENLNKDTRDGCHITSMAGSWMCIVYGFAGLEIKDSNIHLNPYLPASWTSFCFNISFRNKIINIRICKDAVEISSDSDETFDIFLNKKLFRIKKYEKISCGN
ncbi:MAG: beta-phosphoglucomutase [Clostridiaceae bacterium]